MVLYKGHHNADYWARASVVLFAKLPPETEKINNSVGMLRVFI